MRLCVCGPGKRVAAVHGEHVVDLNALDQLLAEQDGEAAADRSPLPASLDAFIEAGAQALAAARTRLRAVDPAAPSPTVTPALAPLSEVELHPPVSSHARMFMAGNNFPAHAAGAAGEMRINAAVEQQARADVREAGLRGFITFVENCVGPRGEIVCPARTDMLDFEGEVAVVLGGRAKDVGVAEARSLIYGLVLINDFSARRAVPRADNPTSRFARDKNFDSSKAVGPFLVIGELDPDDVDWVTQVNGEVRQRGSTSKMIFSFAEMISYLSEDLTLRPGDVIGGGTPEGTVMDSTPRDEHGNRDPAAFLQIGDVVEVCHPRLGAQHNRIVQKELS
jgi:2-keto-4-pentenoate hydratase/2-oxohepta-3-ene-1,7-dioic acid hydratase in catechol pathway